MKRGELWIINLEPGFGREIHKKRPALILSEDSINQKTTNVIIIPASSIVPQTIGVEMIRIGEKEGLRQDSVLLPIFIRSVDHDRLIKKIGELSKKKLHQVEEAIRLVLGLEEALL